ncbi:MAG: acyl-CoA dehydrogenase family protein [Pseudomonadota bacterium]
MSDQHSHDQEPEMLVISETHEVFNQPPKLEHFNTFEQDQPLVDALRHAGGSWGEQQVADFGALLGKPEWIERGFQANKNKPVFHSHDRYGYRVDRVDYHPAYHDLMSLAIEHDIHALPWNRPQPGAHAVRLAMNYLYNQNEAGSACPLTMTFACVPAIQKTPSLAKDWLPKILSREYDSSFQPVDRKRGATIGMAMTEKQGGTDVRANTSYAYPAGDDEGPGEAYELVGHKWFCSAPMCDAFLTLAQTDNGLSCFLLPRWRPDGSRNEFYIQRLKDKMGNRSNASSEVEFRGAHAWMLGEEGRGVPTIIEMVALTRYDCMIGSTSLMRQAVAQVTHHIAHREVMGKRLIDQPLMQNVAADLCLEVEGALAMTMRLAMALDNPENEDEQNLVRLTTAVGKYWICKRATHHIGESQECLGGIGYVEESIMARLYREAPVNSIWEGSGNVQCLDVLRAVSKAPAVLDVFIAELEKASGQQADYDASLEALKAQLADFEDFQFRARSIVEHMARQMQACQLILMGNELIYTAFCRARLGEQRGLSFGNLPADIDCRAIIERARPKVD